MVPTVTLGPYELLERIAVGGMAEVFLARRKLHSGLDKQVVIKCLLPDLGRTQDHLDLFEQEARLTASIASEFMVQVYDVGVERGRPYLVLEHVEGVNLAQLLAQVGVLPPLEAAYIGSCLGSALASLHRATGPDGEPLEIVHRDVSPSNVLLSVEGGVKLADLGVARSRSSRIRTELGTFKGKIAYASPEQVRSDPVDARTDLYGLGLVLFEALTGERYLDADDDLGMLQCALEPPRRRPSELRMGLPPELDAAVARCLEPMPERRFPSAETLLSALDACQPQGTGRVRAQLAERVRGAQQALPPPQPLEAALRPGSVFAPPEPSRPPSSRRWRWVTAMGISAAVASGIALWPSTRSDPAIVPVEPPPPAAPSSPLPAPALDQEAASPTEPKAPEREAPAATVSGPPASQPDLSESPTMPQPPDDDQTRQAVEAALASIVLRREQRGLLPEDVPEISSALAQLQAASERGELVEILRAHDLATALEAVAIDRSFIDAKLRRLDERLAGLDPHREDGAELRQRIHRALSLSVGGRYDQANEELNQLAEML